VHDEYLTILRRHVRCQCSWHCWMVNLTLNEQNWYFIMTDAYWRHTSLLQSFLTLVHIIVQTTRDERKTGTDSKGAGWYTAPLWIKLRRHNPKYHTVSKAREFYATWRVGFRVKSNQPMTAILKILLTCHFARTGLLVYASSSIVMSDVLLVHLLHRWVPVKNDQN
jgi:hypothetical protein